VSSDAGGRAHISVLTLAAVYVGTVVGAGFASGQEILLFFSLHGLPGFAALIIATAVLGFFGYLLLRTSAGIGAESHGTVLLHIGGPVVGRVIDAVLTFFLFGGTAAMAAGAGATLEQAYGLPYWVGLVGMAAAALVTVVFGIGGVVKSVSVIVPFLLAAVLGVAVATLLGYPVDLDFARPEWAAVPHWALSGVTYGSYNLILAAAVLVPVARLTARRRLAPGAFLGALGLGVGALAVNLAVLAHVPDSAWAEVPMVLAASRLSPLAGLLYTVVLLAEVYTTAVGSLFGFVNRLLREDHPWFGPVAATTAAAAVLAGGLGFSTLVATLYPAVGYAGFLLLGALALAFIRRRI